MFQSSEKSPCSFERVQFFILPACQFRMYPGIIADLKLAILSSCVNSQVFVSPLLSARSFFPRQYMYPFRADSSLRQL